MASKNDPDPVLDFAMLLCAKAARKKRIRRAAERRLHRQGIQIVFDDEGETRGCSEVKRSW